MKNHQRRLRAIELTLTPYQTVLLWLENARKGTFEDGARNCPRSAIANSILKNVTKAIKGESDFVVDRAVRQARQEADTLYNLAVSVNARVLETTWQRHREFVFLAQYLRGITYINQGPHSEEEIRRTVLFFVEEVFLLDGAASQVCVEHFGRQPILFSDSVQGLDHQLDLAATVLKCFSVVVEKLNFKQLTEKSIREALRSDIALQGSLWMRLARIAMLVEFGEVADCSVAYSDLARELGKCKRRFTPNRAPRDVSHVSCPHDHIMNKLPTSLCKP